MRAQKPDEVRIFADLSRVSVIAWTRSDEYGGSIDNRARVAIGADVASGAADLEACGQMALADPDSVTRVKTGSPLNDAQRDTFFGDDARTYIDSPALSGAAAG